MPIVEKKFNEVNPLTGKKESYFLNYESREKYRRIVGGIAWPSVDRAGCCLALTEDYEKDIILGERLISVLTMYENLDAIDLLRRCDELSGSHSVMKWFGDPGNIPMMDFLYKFNKERNRQHSERGLNIAPAPYFDDSNNLSHYLHIIRHRGIKKTIHLGETLASIVHGLPQDDLHGNAKEFPPVAALGYALSEIENSPDPSEVVSMREQIDEHFAQFQVDGI